jgi:hypothetical protein
MEGSYLDLGVVLFQTNDGTGAFVDGGGRAQNAAVLSAAAFVDGAVFQAGRADTLACAVHMARAGVTNVHAQLLQRRDDRNNPGVFAWAPVMTTRSDTGVSAFAQTLAAADGADIFLTCAPRGSGSFKWQVKVDGVPAAGDKVVIGVGAA